MGLAQSAGGALHGYVAVGVADDGSNGGAGLVDQARGPVVAGAGLPQAEFGAAGNGIFKFGVQAAQLGLEHLHLGGIQGAELVGPDHLAEQHGQVAIAVCTLRGGVERAQHARELLRQRREAGAALGFVPQQQAGVAKAPEHRVQRFGAHGVEQFVDLVAGQVGFALAQQAHEDEQPQPHQPGRAVEQAAQCVHQAAVLVDAPGEDGFAGKVSVAKVIRQRGVAVGWNEYIHCQNWNWASAASGAVSDRSTRLAKVTGR